MSLTERHQVLVVDDDREFAEEFAELLECFGCAVSIEGTLQSAQVALASKQFRYAVVDLGLGDDSGLSLAHEFAHADDVRMVLLSGRRLTPSERASFDGEPPCLLIKPASGADILKALGINPGT